jgi:oligopeptide/dipeptide ABC transporter ATP-binding protein
VALLEVQDLTIDIAGVQPLDAIGFSVEKGEILGLVGESGSGKSLTALSIMGLLPLIGGRITRGSVRFDGKELVGMAERDLRRLRGRRIAFITQNPMTSLDPVMRVGAQIDQVSRLHLGLGAREAAARSIALMERLRIPGAATVYHHYPHQLSGGMKQRIVIAMALAADPDLIIADEPTTALDVTIQAQIVQLLVELARDRGLALILITHDMGVVAQACDRVVVLYAGRVAESSDVKAIFARPRHPYTKALIRCIPREGMARGSLTGIPGSVPSVARYPEGCRFHPRCAACVPLCAEQVPALRRLAADGTVACHVAEGAAIAGEAAHV